MHDAIVVGGGPGGLYAASKLASAGLSVRLFEEHAMSGEPVHCTGVLAADVFDEFGLDSDSILNHSTASSPTLPYVPACGCRLVIASTESRSMPAVWA